MVQRHIQREGGGPAWPREEAERGGGGLLAELFAVSPDRMAVHRLPGTEIIAVSDAFCSELGFARGEVLGKTPGEIHLFRHQQQLEGLFETVAREGHVGAFAAELRRKEGLAVPTILSARVFRRGSDQLVIWSGRDPRDVSAPTDTEERYRALEQELRISRKLESVGLLASGMAHGLNHLLSLTVGYCELLSSTLDAGSPNKQGVVHLVDATKKASNLVRHLSAFASRQLLALESLELNALIDSMQASLGPLMGDRIEIDFRLDPSLGLVHADRAQLQQLILSLALVARDEMPQGGRLTIGTQKYTGGLQSVVGLGTSYAILSVIDQRRDKLVKGPETRVEQEDSERSALVVSVVGRIVRHHGGQVRVRFDNKVGTITEVFLPITDVARAPGSNGCVKTLGDATVLLLEEDAATREFAAAILRRTGYHVLETSDPSEAQRWIEDTNQDLDLLVADLQSARSGSDDLAIASTKARPHLKVLYMCSIAQGMQSGREDLDSASLLLTKPFSMVGLSRMVARALRGDA